MCQIFHVTINIYLTHIFISHMLSDRFFAWFGKGYLLLNQSAVQSVTYLGSHTVRHTVTQFVNQPISQSDRLSDTLCEKCWNSEFFWSVFSSFGLNTEIRSISPYSVRLRENKDQKNSEYGHFPCRASQPVLSYLSMRCY